MLAVTKKQKKLIAQLNDAEPIFKKKEDELKKQQQELTDRENKLNDLKSDLKDREPNFGVAGHSY